MKAWIVTGLCLLLSACAHTPATSPATAAPLLLSDQLFPAPPPAELQDDVFALSPAMRSYLRTGVATRMRSLGPREGLFDAIRNDLLIQYDATITRNAADAFAARSGNCLSLVILTAAMARELEIPVRYQSVFDNDTWSRNNGLTFLSGHINITLGQRTRGAILSRDTAPSLTIDFLLPEGGAAAMRTKSVDENTVVAMYRNNRAAETLALGQLNAAYWWAREAIRIAPAFLPAYNTLGVIYRHHGQPQLAEQAFRHALQREPGNALVLGNLADLLAQTGRNAEATQLRAGVAELQKLPPYHYFDIGLAALKLADYAGARKQFEQQLRRTPYDHEVLFALGMAQMRLGELRAARRSLDEALENSTTQQSQGIYAAKLEHIKTLQRQSTVRGGS